MDLFALYYQERTHKQLQYDSIDKRRYIISSDITIGKKWYLDTYTLSVIRKSRTKNNGNCMLQ